MPKYQFTRTGGPWEYPTLHLTLASGDVVELAAAPDAHFGLVADATPVTVTPAFPPVGFVPSAEPADGALLVYSRAADQYVPALPAAAGVVTTEGANATYQPVDHRWAAGLAVKAGQIVENAGTLYKVNTDHTLPGTFSTTNLTSVGGGGGGASVAYDGDGDLALSGTKINAASLVKDRTLRAEKYSAPNSTGTDSGAALTQMLADGVAMGGARFDFRDQSFYTSRAGVSLGQGRNAQVALPELDLTQRKVVLEFEGESAAPISYYGQSVTDQPMMGGIQSLRTGATYSGTNKVESVIGARAADPARLVSSNAFTNLLVRFHNFTVRAPNNPSFAGVDLTAVLQCDIEGLTIDTPASYAGTVSVPSTPQAFGLMLPTVQNNALVRVRRLIVCGFYGSLAWNEHADVDDALLLNSKVALVPWGPLGYRASRFGIIAAENQHHVIAGVDPATGVLASLQGRFLIAAQCINVEDAGGPYAAFANVEHLKGVVGLLSGEIGFGRVLGGTGIQPGLSGAPGPSLELRDRATGIVHPASGNVASIQVGATTSDTFNRTDSPTTLGTPETTVGGAAYAGTGTWGIRAGKAYLASAKGGSAVYYTQLVESGKNECRLKLTVEMSPNVNSNGNPKTDAGIAGWGSDAANHMYAAINGTALTNGGQVQLYKRVAGVFTLLGTPFATGRLFPGSQHVIEVSKASNVYRVYFDGILVITYTGTTGLEANTKHFATVGLQGTGSTNGNDDGLTNLKHFSVV